MWKGDSLREKIATAVVRYKSLFSCDLPNTLITPDFPLLRMIAPPTTVEIEPC